MKSGRTEGEVFTSVVITVLVIGGIVLFLLWMSSLSPDASNPGGF